MDRSEPALIAVGLCLLFTVQASVQTPSTETMSHVDRHTTNVSRQDDLFAIGHRNIGGKGLGNWYSIAQENDLGHVYSRCLEQDVTLLTDPAVTEYVNWIGQNLVRHSDARVLFTIKIIESDEINAYTLPGGFLYVNSALITTAQDVAELAAVMAHEIAHVAAHHAARQMSRSQVFALATLPIIFVGGPFGIAMGEAGRLITLLISSRFSWHFEREDDYLGVEYMFLSGYDPQALISFFERIQKLEHEKAGTLAKIFAMHPQTADRIRRTQSEIARILPPPDLYVAKTSECDSAKMRLTGLSRRQDREERIVDCPTAGNALLSSPIVLEGANRCPD